MKKYLVSLTLLLGSTWLGNAYAALDLELTKGVAAALPIAVVPFQNGAAAPVNISQVIADDLGNSGEFSVMSANAMKEFPSTPSAVNSSYWQKQNINDVVIGNIQPDNGGKYKVTYDLVDLYNKAGNSNGVLLTQSYTVSREQLRGLAHHISDQIYQALTGQKGIFSTKLAYIVVQRNSGQANKYMLEVSDFDGQNAHPILISSQPIMSPTWSPDGKRIAYVSFESYLPQIYISDITTGKRQLITSFQGINGAPAWSPDGSKLAAALSKGSANPNIYTLNLNSGQLQQVTADGSINTEPSWSPDGNSLIFTSDRGGSPQIYQINLASRATQRLTYDGNYNSTASYTADGQHIIMLHRSQGVFNIGVLDLQTGNIQTITNSGKNQSPSVAPNGKMVVFASEYGSKGVLGIVSIDGKVNLRIPDAEGNVQEPAWSPYLS